MSMLTLCFRDNTIFKMFDFVQVHKVQLSQWSHSIANIKIKKNDMVFRLALTVRAMLMKLKSSTMLWNSGNTCVCQLLRVVCVVAMAYVEAVYGVRHVLCIYKQWTPANRVRVLRDNTSHWLRAVILAPCETIRHTDSELLSGALNVCERRVR